jgi:hypothetical protein
MYVLTTITIIIKIIVNFISQACESLFLRNNYQQDAIVFLNLFQQSVLCMFRIQQLFIIRRQLLYMQHVVFTTNLR